MRQILIAFFILATGHELLYAQDVNKKQSEPCYTRQWADSVNTATLKNINTIAPVLVEWYAYEGQTQKLTLPPNIVNVVYIKPQATCPEKKSAVTGGTR